MATTITMPKMGLSMVTGKVGRWLKQEGDAVSKGEAVVEIMTDKITNIIEAPDNGILLKILAETDKELPIGGLLGIIGAAGEAVAATGGTGTAAAVTEPAAKPTVAIAAGAGPAVADGSEKVKISPLARKIAEENGLDITRITGSGPSGRITREDVEKALAGRMDTVAFTVSPYSGMRKVIGDNMAHSWAIAPKVTYHVSVDVSALLTLRKTINEDAEEKITITDMLVKIVARALKMRPNMNVSLDGGNIRTYLESNIGVAVALDSGLVVPVVKNAEVKTLSQISREIKDYSQRARENRLGLEEMQGGTFTITNVGAYNSVDYFTPIINQPESAILGVGRTVNTPVAVNGDVVVRPLLGLSLAFDHRIIDGAPAAEFLGLLIKLIEKPYKVFI